MTLQQYINTNNLINDDVYFLNYATSYLSLFLNQLVTSNTKGTKKNKYIMFLNRKDKKLSICYIDNLGNIIEELGTFKKKKVIKIYSKYFLISTSIVNRVNTNFYN